jgi:hypothetical protein
VCAEQRDEIAGQLDLTSLFGELPEGVDGQQLVDAMTITISDRSVTLLSVEGDTAEVQLGGSMSIAIDEAAAREFMRQVLEALGQPSDDATIDGFLPSFLESMAAGTDLGATILVVREDGEWLMCDDLSPDAPVESFDPNATLEPITNALCDLITVEELNGLSSLAFETATPETNGCTYDAPYDVETGGFFSVNIRLEDGDVQPLKEAFAEGRDVTVAGHAGWGTDTATWVGLGDGRLFTIQPILFGASGAEAIDVIEFATRIGEIAIPRLPA